MEARGICPVQVMAHNGARAMLRRAAGLMTREAEPLEPRTTLRRVAGCNVPADGPGSGGQGVAAERGQWEPYELATMRAEAAQERADALRGDLAGIRGRGG